jgi:hypothetical protein
MPQLPEAAEQILRAHAPFIRAVVQACRDPALRPQLMAMLQAAEDQGWQRLVGVIRAILGGRRDRSVLLGLDDEDRVIAEAILAGLEDPTNLPPLAPPGDPITAAPGLAAMIHAAARGDVRAFSALADMAEQMLRVGGDMARLGGIMRRLVDGERDADLLCRGMGPLGRSLVLDILSELARLRTH